MQLIQFSPEEKYLITFSSVEPSNPRDPTQLILNIFDVRTGKRIWIFHTIPMKGEFGYDSWLIPGQAEMVGNAGVWAQMSIDEELGLVYLPVESPTGDYNGQYRHGNGLFGEIRLREV